MFSHVMVGANDLERSKTFYDALFGARGAKPAMMHPNGHRFVYAHDGALFMVTIPIDGESAMPANGGTIGFAMESPEAVDAWHRAGCEAGGTSCEDPPGLRESPLGPLYLAYLRDPDGNKLVGVYREA